MRITLPAAFTLLALASPMLFAAEDPFVGPSIAIGASVGQLGNKVDPSSDLKNHLNKSLTKQGVTIDLNTHSSTDSSSSVQPLLDFSWNWRIAPTWVAGAGINVETGERKGPDSTFSSITAKNASQTKSAPLLTASLKMSQHVGIYGLIGKQLDENWLLYGKLGYHHAKADSTFRAGDESINTQSFDLNGIGAGVGAAYNLKNGLELRPEAEYISFDSYTHKLEGQPVFSGKPNMTRVNLMVGYRF